MNDLVASFEQQIVIGITAGIISSLIFTFIVFVISLLWRKAILPTWENMLYKDIRLDGKWDSIFIGDSKNEDKEIVTLNQVGHRVSGEIFCVKGPDEGRKYKFEGTFKNQILIACYWTTEKRRLDSGSFTLHLKDNGKKLQGYASYYYDNKHKIESGDYCWTRTKYS